MTSGEIFYRIKAAEFHAKALDEASPQMRAELEGLAAAYLRLAEYAERNKQLDVSYEMTPPKEAEPDAQY